VVPLFSELRSSDGAPQGHLSGAGINGERNASTPELNLPAIRKALQEGGNQHSKWTFARPQHLFHTPKGRCRGIRAIEETFSPEALEKIAAWIVRQP